MNALYVSTEKYFVIQLNKKYAMKWSIQELYILVGLYVLYRLPFASFHHHHLIICKMEYVFICINKLSLVLHNICGAFMLKKSKTRNIIWNAIMDKLMCSSLHRLETLFLPYSLKDATTAVTARQKPEIE